MNAALLIFLTIICFALGFRFYSRFLGRHLFDIVDDENTPAKYYYNSDDYVPTSQHVLWGHHFSSVAGAAPIVGPAVAIIWGWVPALIWIVLGTIFMGAAHDFGALVLSMRHRGLSLPTLSGELISKRVRNLFLIVVLFLVWMVIAVFTLIIANLFVSFPSSVLPVNFEIFVALFIGYFINKKGRSLLWPSIFAQLILFLMIVLGSVFPIDLSSLTNQPLLVWIIFLLIYSFVASILPVWALLQPRDYINSHQLILGLLLIVSGVFILNPPVVAPAFQMNPQGAPPWFPFLFITIACGAISGFHGLVCAGTTSKQVKNWAHTRSIGYGAMIGEASLAILATLAVSAGFATSEDWAHHYSSWEQAQGLAASINAFVLGSSRFLEALGLDLNFSKTLVSVLIISFAATSLDTATRIQRYIFSEIGELAQIKFLQSPFISAGLAVLSAFFLMAVESNGKGGLILWPLFGATNQMLAALTLILICSYLIKRKKPTRYYFLPFLFIFTITVFGLALNIIEFLKQQDWLLSVLASLLLITSFWICLEAILVIRKQSKEGYKRLT